MPLTHTGRGGGVLIKYSEEPGVGNEESTKTLDETESFFQGIMGKVPSE